MTSARRRSFFRRLCRGGRLRAWADAELDVVAVAVAVRTHALVFDAAAAVGCIMGVAAADFPALRLPDAAHENPRPGQDRGAVRQMHGAQRLSGERADARRAAERVADAIATESVAGPGMRAGRRVV